MTDPTRPTSVYRFWDANNRLLYVGITHRGWRRFDEHASAKAWWHLVDRVTVDHHPSRESARAAELAAIQGEHPQFNVADTRRPPISAGRKPALPFVSVDDGMTCHVINRQSGNRRTEPLCLDYEVNCSSMSDDWIVDEIDAFDLFDMWFDRYYDKFSGQAPIYWFVAGPSVFESAIPQFGPAWDSYYYPPIEASTGRRVPLCALPVRREHWCEKASDKGGFIEEATRWRPTPFTTSVSMDMLMDLARFHHGTKCGR